MNVNAQFMSERVETDIVNTDESLSPGMYADILIYSKGKTSGFTVPRSSLVTSTERKYVLVLRSGSIQKVDVTSGNESGNLVEVFVSLDKTDSFVVRASDDIKEGQYTTHVVK